MPQVASSFVAAVCESSSICEERRGSSGPPTPEKLGRSGETGPSELRWASRSLVSLDLSDMVPVPVPPLAVDELDGVLDDIRFN